MKTRARRSAGHKSIRALQHIIVTLGSLGLLIANDQNPRVLLYAYCVALFIRMPTVQYFATRPDSPLLGLTRVPTQFDKGKPYRAEKTRAPAGLATYLVAIFSMAIMLGVVLAMGQGTEIFAAEIFIPELTWAIFLGFVFWLEDLFTQQIIIEPESAVYQNLGYNTPALNFMLAAISIAALIIVVSLPLGALIMGKEGWNPNLAGWAVLTAVALLKLAFQVKADFANPEGFAALSDFEARHRDGKGT